MSFALLMRETGVPPTDALSDRSVYESTRSQLHKVLRAKPQSVSTRRRCDTYESNEGQQCDDAPKLRTVRFFTGHAIREHLAVIREEIVGLWRVEHLDDSPDRRTILPSLGR